MTIDPRASGDLALALQQAVDLYQGDRFDSLACARTDDEAARIVTATADVFVAWLRKPVTFNIDRVHIEEMDSGELVRTEGITGVTTIDSSQQARYPIDPEDDRGFDVNANLTATLDPEGFGTVEILPPTETDRFQALVKFAAPGTATLTITDVDSGLAFTDAVLFTPGGIATLGVGAPVVEEQPAPPAPEESPAPPAEPTI